MVSDETAEANGLFTISDGAAGRRRSRASPAPASRWRPSDLFDLSLLDEVYEENPDLNAYAG